MAYLGVDLGTSGVKVLAIGADRRPIAQAHAELEVARPHPGWSEQEPASWIEATREALAALARQIDMAQVRGIGLSGQMHGAVALDSADDCLRPAILWNDTRSADQAARFDEDPAFREITGNIVFPGFTAPKLAWMAEEEPELFERIEKVLLPKDYLRLWLTGEHLSDMSDAAGTAWLDVAARDWSDALLAATGLSRLQMPGLVEGSAVAGHLRRSIAEAFGLRPGIPVAGGGGDNAASACGVGALGNGGAFASLGTSGVLFASTGAYRPNAGSAVHTFCHAVPGTWHQMGVILSATDSLNWLARITGCTAADLAAEIEGEPAAPGPELFLPYLGGERTPHNDAAIRGQLLNVSHQSDRAALTRAVMDGVSFAFRDCLEALRAAGTELSRVTALGGGSASAWWLGSLANALDVAVDIPEDGDFGAAFGAARLGLCAAEGADPAAVCTPPPVARTIEPAPSLRAAYDEAHARYRAAYPALKGAMP